MTGETQATETVQVNVRVPAQTARRFRAACALAGAKHGEVVANLMEQWLAEQGQ
jgi:hypothetical protein